MANYYVSIQRGNDSNDGLTPAEPFATITKATAEVAAGDTVYIGPGVYRERIVLVTSGTSVDSITWYPDPNGKYVTGDNPGMVRITGVDANGYPDDEGSVLDGSNVVYNTIGALDGRMYVDGVYDTTLTPLISLGFASVNHNTLINVIGHGCLVVHGGICTNCYAMGNYGFVYSVCTNCVGYGADSAFYSSTGLCIQCIAFGGTGFNGVDGSFGCVNCMSFSFSGFRKTENYNCCAVGAHTGFTDGIVTTCVASYCDKGFVGDATTLPVTGNYAVMCYDDTEGTITGTTNSIPMPMFDLSKLLEAFKPFEAVTVEGFDVSSFVTITHDILGYERRLGMGELDIGPYENSVVTLDFTEVNTQTPSIKIQLKGMAKFTFYADAGEAFTRSVYVKWANVDAAKKPQLIIKGAHITTQTATATGSGTTWEQLTVSTTPSTGGEVELYLYARDEDVDAVVYFSDLE
jgi:hypothetical protein